MRGRRRSWKAAASRWGPPPKLEQGRQIDVAGTGRQVDVKPPPKLKRGGKSMWSLDFSPGGHVPTLIVCVLAVLVARVDGQVGSAAAREYRAYVASEAADVISVVRFGPQGLALERTVPTGLMPNDIDGPHGVAMSPDRKSYFVSLAHGQPFGAVWKYSVADDKVLGQLTLGMFPATMQVTPDGEFLYVVNFNLHGDRVPSSVSVVATHGLLEVARIRTCLMPHGSRINSQGTRHYSACMMDDTLVEIDTGTLKVSRHFTMTPDHEVGHAGAPIPVAPRSDDRAAHAAGHGSEPPPPGTKACSPTWAQPSADGRRIFVACNASSDIVEIDADAWMVLRHIPAGPGVYNLAVTGDGRLLIATNRRGQSVSIIDITSGKELARLPTKRRVVHGIAVTDDDTYAFVTAEGVASEPGTVEVIDLRTLKTAATLDLPPQAGGVDVLPARLD
jgi:DNA-binding beta-propeller fold protein YncE